MHTNDEELELSYEEACDEAAELAQELRATKLEAQRLRLRLLAAGRASRISGSCVQTAHPKMPAVEPEALTQTVQGIRDMFQWIANHVDLSRPPEVLDVGCEVPVGGRNVHLQRVVQWPLSFASSERRLKVSVPIEYEDEIAGLLKTAKSVGQLGPRMVQQLAESWELVPGELSTPTQSCAEPAVLLAHRGSSRGILVASWPTQEALEAFALLNTLEGAVPSIGERVEALYEGAWYLGTLEALDANGKAVVKCDVDDPGVFTVVPLKQVRKPPPAKSSTSQSAIAAPACHETPSVRCGMQNRRSHSAM